MDIKEIRYKHARRLVESVGGISRFAERLEKGQSQVSQFAGENPNKGIGHQIAREIEAAFSLDHGAIDAPLPEWLSGKVNPSSITQGQSVSDPALNSSELDAEIDRLMSEVYAKRKHLGSRILILQEIIADVQRDVLAGIKPGSDSNTK